MWLPVNQPYSEFVYGSQLCQSIEWSKRLDRFQISGMTLSQFCKQENVSPHSFYYWKKQLAAAQRAQVDDTIIKRRQMAIPVQHVAFCSLFGR